jgi:hypothetical protein
MVNITDIEHERICPKLPSDQILLNLVVVLQIYDQFKVFLVVKKEFY